MLSDNFSIVFCSAFTVFSSVLHVVPFTALPFQFYGASPVAKLLLEASAEIPCFAINKNWLWSP
jgi:hypothetical protein